MKFFIVLALVALVSANPNYRRSYGGSLLNSGSSFGSSGLSLGGGYGSGLSLGGGYGSGLSLGRASYGSGLTLGGGYGSGLGLGGQVAKVALIQAVPVSLASQQVAIAAPAYSGSYSGSYGVASQQVSGPITAAIQSTRNVQVVDVASTGSAAAPQSIVIGPSVQPIDIEFQSQSSPVSVRQTHIPGQANPPQSSSHQEEPDYLRQEIVKPVIHEVTEAIQPYRRITQEVRPVQETINQLITRGQQQSVAVQGQSLGLGSAQYVAQAAPVAVEAVSQPATVALLLTGNSGLSGLSGSSYGTGSGLSLGSGLLSGSSLGSGLSYGGSSLGSGLSYGGSSLGSGLSYGGSSLGSSGLSLGSGLLSGSSFSSKPASLTTSSVGVDNYRRRA